MSNLVISTLGVLLKILGTHSTGHHYPSQALDRTKI
jgi:hypothetical protein